MIQFSVLISVYAKENPIYFSKCLDSVVTQSLVPNELIIVKDGPLTHALEEVIERLSFEGTLTVIDLPENVTQGPARAIGLLAANYEWVAIMDSDDLCCSDRFEKQVRMIEENPMISLIGGQIDEFLDSPNKPVSQKCVPVTHSTIVDYAKKRNPFNHMTVMLKRDIAIQAGNYDYFPGFEDYDLFIRMIKLGALCGNHTDVLVHARVGNGMYKRRRGLKYIQSEWQMQQKMRHIGLVNNIEFLVNLCVRIPVRLLPAWALELLYKQFTRGGN